MVQEKVNREMQVPGILRCMIDTRRTDNKALIELVEEEYKDLCFQTVITRTAATGRLSINGFTENPELNHAVIQYRESYFGQSIIYCFFGLRQNLRFTKCYHELHRSCNAFNRMEVEI